MSLLNIYRGLERMRNPAFFKVYVIHRKQKIVIKNLPNRVFLSIV